MRTLTTYIALPLLAVASTAVAQVATSDGYRMVWEDTFDGTELNVTDSWNIEVNGDGGGNHELQYYNSDNVSVGVEPASGASCLILTARAENMNGKTATSGRVNTKHKVYTQYGKVEARIKLPSTADGLWPAFWLLGEDITEQGWPRCGEIDVLEMGHSNGIKNNVQDRLFNGACHWGVSHRHHLYNAQDSVASYSLQDGNFHLYTVVWEPDCIKMYLDRDVYPDAAPYYTLDITDKSSADACGNFFNKPYFIILNLAVGGDYPGIYDVKDITALSEGDAQMYIDYVRIYQRNEDTSMNKK